MNPKDVLLPKYVQAEANDDYDSSDVVAPHDYAPGIGPEVPGTPRP